MSTSIEQGAIFVADAHYPNHGDAFLKLLKKIDKGEIKTPQLFSRRYFRFTLWI